MQDNVTSNDITVAEQFFLTNATYHKFELSDSIYSNVKTLLDGVSSFSMVNIEEITETDYEASKAGLTFAKYGDPNFSSAFTQPGSSLSDSPWFLSE